MRALSAEQLLEVWEVGFAQAPIERALAILAVACPESSPDALAALSMGARDARLLTLREELWGPRMEAVVACPACRERLELPLDTLQLLSASPQAPQWEISLSIGEYNMTFRLPTSQDIFEASGGAGPEAMPLWIAHECLLQADTGGVSISADKLPETVLDAVADAMAEADPLADIRLGLTCPFCDHRWRAVFDIVSFLWTEIEAWAWRILSDVHTLARAYGWGEREILTLSPTRRQFYLDMVGA